MWRMIAACMLSVLWLPTTGVAAEEPSVERQNELLSLLQQDCGSCHGLTLKGGLGPSLLPAALAGKPRELLLDTVRNGRPGTAMPPWRPILSEQEIDWLVDRLLAGDGAFGSTEKRD